MGLTSSLPSNSEPEAVETLSKLSPNLLAKILRGRPYSHLVITLWKCGDRSLNAKLAEGIKYIHLKDERLETTSRYPKLLSSLSNLRYLSINRGVYSLMPYLELSHELQLLQGRKMKVFELKCHNANRALRRYNITHSPPLELHSVFSRGDSRLWLSKVFPKLAHLRIRSHDNSKSAISEKDFSGLPDGLLYFSMPLLHAKSHQPIFSTLPRALEVLKTVIVADTNFGGESGKRLLSSDLYFADAPPTLTTIKGIQDFNHSDLDHLRIPKSLTKCDIFCHAQDWTLSTLSDLPLQLSISNTLMFSPDLFKSALDDAATLLAANITSLELSRLPSKVDEMIKFMQLLPRKLTRLSFSYVLPSDEVAERFEVALKTITWPSTLSYFSIWRRWPSHLVYLLPSSIKTLDMMWPASNSVHLPSSLTDLTANIPHLFCPKPLMRLKLTSLTLHAARKEAIKLLSRLPSCLTSLTLHSSEFSFGHSEDGSSQLEFPPNLLTLITTELDLSLLISLPPSITCLEISNLKHSGSVGTDTMAMLLQRLPLGLQSLVLGIDMSHRFSGDACLHFLSRLQKLTKLVIGGGCIFDGEVLKLLPKSLKTVGIALTTFSHELAGGVNPQWTTACLSLPQRCHYELLAQYYPLDCPLLLEPLQNEAMEPVLAKRRNAATAADSMYPHPLIRK